MKKKWFKECPKEKGFYWNRRKGRKDLIVWYSGVEESGGFPFHIRGVNSASKTDTFTYFNGTSWYGPIKLPKGMIDEIEQDKKYQWKKGKSTHYCDSSIFMFQQAMIDKIDKIEAEKTMPLDKWVELNRIKTTTPWKSSPKKFTEANFPNFLCFSSQKKARDFSKKYIEPTWKTDCKVYLAIDNGPREGWDLIEMRTIDKANDLGVRSGKPFKVLRGVV
uniref:Uncharacterized protein n=1 Tax=viral metagenome TaxID=1070528 RepID=A0A6M3LKQ6_9ZZZZ